MNYDTKRQAALNDPRSTEELVGIALARQDDEVARKSVEILHWRGDHETLEAARRLCASADSRERKLGADILGQLGIPDRSYPDECLTILLKLLEHEADVDVLHAIGIACGHLKDSRAIEALVRLKDHPRASVRYAVVFGLLTQKSDLAIQTLIELSDDEDDEVRDWATFGLGSQIDADSEFIRDTLVGRLTDLHDEARGEAMVGLARRKDARVVEPLLMELLAGCAGFLPVEAAREIGDPRLYDALVRLREQLDTDDEALEEAIRRCEEDRR